MRTNNMTKKENKNQEPVNAALNYAHPYFVPIDDGDEATIKHYKNNDVPVAHIALPGRMKHYYAVFDADTHEEADLMNRTFNTWEKRNARYEKARMENETSYEKLLDDGYEPSDSNTNPEEIIAYKVVMNALNEALDELSEEKLCACKMVANKEPQRKVADELGISRRTLRNRKDDAMLELGRKMNIYR